MGEGFDSDQGIADLMGQAGRQFGPERGTIQPVLLFLHGFLVRGILHDGHGAQTMGLIGEALRTRNQIALGAPFEPLPGLRRTIFAQCSPKQIG